MRVKNIRYLLIFDNPQTYAQIQNFLPCTHDKPGRHVFLTSRNANIWIHKVEIGAFERQESLQFIQKILPKKKKEEMERLAEALSDYPMGLTLAVEFIDSHPTSTIDKYLSMHLKKTLKKREKNSSPLLDQYPKAALSALELSLDAIEEKSKDSLQALFFICLLNSKDIPESYMDFWLKKASSSLTTDEAIKHIYDQSLIGVSEATEFTTNIKPKIKAKEKEKKKLKKLIFSRCMI